MKDYIIVGGGPSGLSLAYELSKFGYSVQVIEKDDQLGGSWKSNFDQNGYFQETSPKVFIEGPYTKKLLKSLNINENEFRGVYGTRIETILKLTSTMYNHFSPLDYIKYLYGYLYITVHDKKTLQEFIDHAGMSEKGRLFMRIISSVLEQSPSQTNARDFFIGLDPFITIKQMIDTNKWHREIEKSIVSQGNIVQKSASVKSINKINNGFSVNTLNGVFYAKKVVLATQSDAIANILQASPGLENNWGPIEKIQEWSQSTHYSSFGFQLHFDTIVEFPEQWCWSCQDSWNIIILPVSNWLTKFSNRQNIKTVWSCCIVNLDDKSSVTSKTVNETSEYQEVLDEAMRQIRQYPNIPEPFKITTSKGLYHNGKKWISANTGFSTGKHYRLKMEGANPGLYALGCFTYTGASGVSYFGRAIAASALYLNTYEKKVKGFNYKEGYIKMFALFIKLLIVFYLLSIIVNRV